MKLNDELLDQVSGGGVPYPFDLDGDDYVGMSPILHCTNCSSITDNPQYSAGENCPVCGIGTLYMVG